MFLFSFYVYLETMTFSIVEFEEGDVDVICTNWLHKEKGTLICFWPNVKTSMEYYKIVQKLTVPDVNEWEKAKVANILGRYDSYNIARIKLKDAEMHSDIATDPESRGKGKRRKKNIYRYGFNTDVEDDYDLKKKSSKRTLYKEKLSIPKLPKELMQFQCTTSRKEKDTVIAAEPCFSAKEQSTQVAKKTASIATHESRETDENYCFTSKLYNSEVEAEKTGCTITPLTSMKEDTSFSISRSRDLYDKHEMSASVIKSLSESEELHKKSTNVHSKISSRHESRKESKKVSHAAESFVPRLTSTDNNSSSRFYTCGKKEKQSAYIVRGSPTSLQKDENAFTPRINKLRKTDRNVSSTVNPLSELMDKNTVVNHKLSHKLPSSLQSSSKSVSTNELFSNKILESVKDIYGADIAVSNMEYNNDGEFSLDIAADAVAHNSISSVETLTKGRSGLQLQKLLHNDECFKKFVISELLENASHRKKFLAHSLQKEHNQFHFDVLECINNVESLVQFDNKLKTDKVYRNKMISYMSKIGGKNSRKITIAIMIRIIHCTLATKYSWKGGKGKRQFCLFNGLLTAVICATRHTKHAGTMVAPDATEEDIIAGIKEFLRQSIGRAKTWEAKQQNERNPDLHEHMSETEEASILSESSEQSEASLTDVEDDSNKHLPDINKKRVSYVKDSDDDSS